jgi:hypothetical protein
MSTTRSELQRQARSAVVQNAFFRWESAVVLAGTIVLTALFSHPFPGWPVWGWPLLGLLGLVALVFASMTSVDARAREFLRLLRQEFDPIRIRDGALRQEVEAAVEYQQHVETRTSEERSGVLRDWLVHIAERFYHWIGSIYELALKLDAYQQDELLAGEQKAVDQRVEELAARRRLERDPVIRRELDAALEVKGRQWQGLRDLDTHMEQAKLGLGQSVAALATVHSQVQLIGTADVESSRSDRLEADIGEQVDRLESLISRTTEILDMASGGDSSMSTTIG